MSTIELEAQKASLAREILCIDDAAIINSVWLTLKGYKQDKTPKHVDLSGQLRGCAADSGLVYKTDKEIKELMYNDKYGI